SIWDSSASITSHSRQCSRLVDSAEGSAYGIVRRRSATWRRLSHLCRLSRARPAKRRRWRRSRLARLIDSIMAISWDDARGRMVDEQLVSRGIGDPRLLEAMRRVPRDRFVPPDAQALADPGQALP